MSAAFTAPHPFDPAGWTPETAERRAVALGLAPLTERHWRVIAACREETARRGRLPGLAALGRLTSLDRPTLVRLFGPDERSALATIGELAGLAASPVHPSPRRTAPRRSLSKEE